MLREIGLKRLFAALIVMGVLAIPSQVEAQASIIRVTDSLCGINYSGGFSLFECDLQLVTTPNGDTNMYLRGTLLGGLPPDQAEHVDNSTTGQFCAFQAPNFEGVITPAGKVNITCRS